MAALTKDELEEFNSQINIAFMRLVQTEPPRQALTNAFAGTLPGVWNGINRRDLIAAAHYAGVGRFNERELAAIVAGVWNQLGPSRGARRTKGRRIFWRYAPVPLLIIDDTNLSHKAQRVAGVLARSVNMGAWNLDLHVDMTYPELAQRTAMSRRSAIYAAKELWRYISVASLGRGGCRFTFRANPDLDPEIEI